MRVLHVNPAVTWQPGGSVGQLKCVGQLKNCVRHSVNCDWQITNLDWHCSVIVGQTVNTDGWHHTWRVGQLTIVAGNCATIGFAAAAPGAPARPNAAPGSKARPWAARFTAGLIAGLRPGSKQPPGVLGHASTADGQMRVLHVNPAVTWQNGGCVGV